MQKIIIAFAGEMGCGKGTVVDYLVKKYNGVSYRFSTILRDILDRLYLEQSRENFQIISPVLRKAFGEDLFSKVIFNDLKNSENSLIILDGVRRQSDLINLKTLSYFKLIYIDTDLKTRYERISKRGENTDDLIKTFEQFNLEQKGEAELQIVGLKEIADYVIDNNSSLENMTSQIDKIMEELRKV